MSSFSQIFGANEGSQSIGFQTASSNSAANEEDIALPYVQLLADFREQVRNIARQEKVGEILKLCDRLRDEDLPNLGVKLEDQEGRLQMQSFTSCGFYRKYLILEVFSFSRKPIIGNKVCRPGNFRERKATTTGGIIILDTEHVFDLFLQLRRSVAKFLETIFVAGI